MIIVYRDTIDSVQEIDDNQEKLNFQDFCAISDLDNLAWRVAHLQPRIVIRWGMVGSPSN